MAPKVTKDDSFNVVWTDAKGATESGIGDVFARIDMSDFSYLRLSKLRVVMTFATGTSLWMKA